jgi:hypothetical protein
MRSDERYQDKDADTYSCCSRIGVRSCITYGIIRKLTHNLSVMEPLLLETRLTGPLTQSGKSAETNPASAARAAMRHNIMI